MNIKFYSDYFSIPSFTSDNKQYEFKDKYIRNKLISDGIYKFVPFTENNSLNENKLHLLKNRQLWVSNYSSFTDKNELKITYDPFKIFQKTGVSSEYLRWLINTTNQLNDVSCFTYSKTDFMWQNYANNFNGFCLEFSLVNSDKFFPVIYINKNNIDFTDDFIYIFINQNKPIIFNHALGQAAILPWVLKDVNFKEENELRFLCGDVYNNEDGPLGGRILAGKKEAMGYTGTTYSYEYAGIKLMNIIIGDKCNNVHQRCLSEIKEEL